MSAILRHYIMLNYTTITIIIATTTTTKIVATSSITTIFPLPSVRNTQEPLPAYFIGRSSI